MIAIILSAGQGTRLRPYTDSRPKSMVLLRGKPLIQYQMQVLKNTGIQEIYAITGYKKESFNMLGISTYYNSRYASTNMVYSLNTARELFDGNSDIIISYGDIVYQNSILLKLVKSKSKISVVIDKKWISLWSLRMANVLSDAETLKLNDNGHIIEIGKPPKSLNQIQGQYIGLIKIRKDFAPEFFNLYDKLKRGILNCNGKKYTDIYMTDYLQLLIDNCFNIRAVETNNGWLEVDTVDDLELYEDLIENGEMLKICNIW